MHRFLIFLLGFPMLSAGEPPSADEERVAALTRLQAEWRREGDLPRRRKLAQEVYEAAMALSWSDTDNEQKKRAAIEEVATDGRLDGADLEMWEKPDPKIVVEELFSLTVKPDQPQPVFRRITRERIEIWTPKHGWLFDARGRLVAEAKPPRRDGIGREWYGAFLPDGRWITTDLWDRDDTLYFFSASGKRGREMPSGKLLPDPGSVDDNARAGLIGWARGDKDGKGWVVSIGSEGGRGRVWVGPGGAPRTLDEWEPWALCEPRQLGSRGYYIHSSVPSDDRKLVFERHEPGHGSGVGFPHYWVQATHAAPGASSTPIAVVPDGGDFGFWPGSHRMFVTADLGEEAPYVPLTWFYDADGNFECRLAARRVGDVDGRAMLFATEDHRVVTLEPDFRMPQMVRFVLHNRVLTPRELYADLRLGVFADGDRLILASWPP